MKTIHRISLFALCAFLLLGCDEKPVEPPFEEPSEEIKSQMKARLSGEWHDINADTKGDTYVFSLNDTMYLKPRGCNDIYALRYRIIGENAIEVKRVWPEVSNEPSRHTVSFLSDDTLYSEKFISIEDGVTKFKNIKLAKDNTSELGKRLIGKWQLVGEGYYDYDGTPVINPVEHTWRYVEFREDLQMMRPYRLSDSTFEEVYPYRTEGNLLFENYLDEMNTFVYRWGIIDDILILECIQGNIPAIPQAKVIDVYKLI